MDFECRIIKCGVHSFEANSEGELNDFLPL